MLQTLLAAQTMSMFSIFLTIKTLLCWGSMCWVNALTSPDSLAASGDYVTQIWPVGFKQKLQSVASGKNFSKGQGWLVSSFFLFPVPFLLSWLRFYNWKYTSNFAKIMAEWEERILTGCWHGPDLGSGYVTRETSLISLGCSSMVLLHVDKCWPDTDLLVLDFLSKNVIFHHLLIIRFVTKSLDLHLTTLPFLLFAYPMSMVVMRTEGAELGGSWKSCSNLNEKYNSSFFIFQTRHWNWYIMN